MAYEEALIRHKDSWEKRHKAMVRYKESHHYNSFTVECPMNKKKAIMGLPLPESLLKMIYDYIYPYKVSHVSYEFSLFRCRMKRQGKMNKTIERYWKAVDPTIYKFDHRDFVISTPPMVSAPPAVSTCSGPTSNEA